MLKTKFNWQKRVYTIKTLIGSIPKDGVHLSIWEIFAKIFGGKLVAPFSLFLSQDPIQAKIEKSSFRPQPDLNPGPSNYKAAVLLTELHCQTA